MRKTLFFVLFYTITLPSFCASILLKSPDSHIRVSIDIKDKIYYSVSYDKDVLMNNNSMQLVLAANTLGLNPKLIRKKLVSINEDLKPEVPLKNSIIHNEANGIKLYFKNDYCLEFRAYNDGIAYRFITTKPDSLIIKNEDASFNFSDKAQIVWSGTKSFKCDYQILYKRKNLGELVKDEMSTLPVLVNDQKYSILFSEADLYDYPAMFLLGHGINALSAAFPKAPLEFGDDGDRSVKILKEGDYIAKTTGTRSFPWRFFVITNRDEQIVANEMVYKLSRPLQIVNTSWIKPGQVTWEWWHNAEVYGVDFKSGYNQNTYKYYIDFASRFGIPYIIMDEGWAKSTTNPFEPNPAINLKELISYGQSKNVKIILWFTWLAVEKNFTIFKTLHDWGIAGVKIDFMDRSDQWMVNFYERVAKEAAKNQILVDFHGAFKPAGLRRAFPNVLSYEGVVGMEANILGGLATPDNNVYLPFLRNAVGPMDYTPGAMRSAHPKDYRGNWTNTMSIGTRVHQMSMYVVFESGLQMLADNPVNYLKELECTEFITGVPVTWDESKIIDAKAGEYIVVARRKNDKWFIGAMTNSKEREINVPANFLKDGLNYSMTLFQDGVNADVQAMDYKKVTKQIHSGDSIKITMAQDGGFVARIEQLK